MRISAISDVHVKKPHDDADRLLSQFFDHPLVQSSDYIVLLGDIFDLMCGPHEEYLYLYDHLFRKIDSLLKQNKKVLFHEGNHDVHLEKLFSAFWPKGEIVPSQAPLIFEIDGKKYYFSHGDEHEVDNLAYQNYKRLIYSGPLKFVANNVMPYGLLNFIGERASMRSRKKGSKAFDESKVRDRFRSGVQETTKGEYDFILGGHSHVKDQFALNEHSLYLNNGYALKSKTFIFIENHVPRFEELRSNRAGP